MATARINNYRMHLVAIGNGTIEAFKDEDAETLASSVSRTPIIKRVTTPVFVRELSRRVSDDCA